jgi:hypothetical protein
MKLMAFEAIIEIGITDRGNSAFFISDRSKTIDGVAFVNEREKKFHTRSPMNK